MFGLFEDPKCPYCGGPLTETGYSFPYPSHRCVRCMRSNREKAKMKEQLKKEILEELKSENP